MVRRRDVEAAASVVRDVVDQPPRPKPFWVRGLAIFALLLVVFPLAARFAQMLGIGIGVGVAAVLTLDLKRRNRTSSRSAQ